MSRKERQYKTYGKYYNLDENAYYELCKTMIETIHEVATKEKGTPNKTWILDEEHLASDKKFFSNDHIKNLVSHFLRHKINFDHYFYFNVRMKRHHMGLLSEDDGPFMGPKEYYEKQRKVIEKCIDKYDKEKLVEAMQ